MTKRATKEEAVGLAKALQADGKEHNYRVRMRIGKYGWPIVHINYGQEAILETQRETVLQRKLANTRRVALAVELWNSGLTLTEVGARLPRKQGGVGVSRERVSQIVRRAERERKLAVKDERVPSETSLSDFLKMEIERIAAEPSAR